MPLVSPLLSHNMGGTQTPTCLLVVMSYDLIPRQIPFSFLSSTGFLPPSYVRFVPPLDSVPLHATGNVVQGAR